MRRDIIKINNLEFKLRIEYFNTKYPYVKIKDDEIIIRSPLENLEKEIIHSIMKKLNQIGLNQLPKEAFNEFLIFGHPYKLYFRNLKRRKYIIIHKKRFIVINPKYKNDFLNYLSRLLLNYVSKKIKYFVKILNINITPEIKIKLLRSKYAYVNNLSLYLSLINIFFPKYIIDYVLAHELIHFKIPGHGYAFKRVIQAIYPNYREIEKDLKSWTIAIFYNKKIGEIVDF